jgi:hypothetical protein
VLVVHAAFDYVPLALENEQVNKLEKSRARHNADLVRRVCACYVFIDKKRSQSD